MRPVHSLFNAAGLFLGALGITVCAAAFILLWVATGRLARITDRAFSKTHGAVEVVRQKVGQVQQRLAAAKITINDIEALVRESAVREVSRHLIQEWRLVEKTDQLASSIEQADDLADFISRLRLSVSETISILQTGRPCHANFS